ncbi:hypothetical protein EBX31_13885, partial [bacterium]|nr:hypothetical protein [bacterium]
PSPSSQLQSSVKPAKPTAGIWFGPEFSTANEVSDCVFRDLPIGIQGGTDKTKGQAEVAVERCVFERCGYGLILENWNSLDWWFWECQFTDCDTAVSNRPGCGEFRVYRTRFVGSKKTDVEVGNLGTFALVENQSKGSRLFLSVSWGMTAGGNFILQGNRVEGATYQGKIATNEVTGMAIYMGNPGPVLMLDNQFVRSNGLTGPDIYFQSANKGNPIGSALLLGNTTTGNSLYEAEKNYEVRVVGDGDVSDGMGVKRSYGLEAAGHRNDPSPAKAAKGIVVEMEAGSDGDQIQAAIDKASDGAVVHLPAGIYRLEKPLVVSAGKKIRIVGDGLLNATTLIPSSDFGMKGLIQVEPGANLELRDLALQSPIQGGGSLGMIVRVLDQDGVLIKGNQVQTTGFGPGVVMEGLDYGRVVLRNHGHNGVTV